VKCLIALGLGSHLGPINMFKCTEEEANFIVWSRKLLRCC